MILEFNFLLPTLLSWKQLLFLFRTLSPNKLFFENNTNIFFQVLALATLSAVVQAVYIHSGYAGTQAVLTEYNGKSVGLSGYSRHGIGLSEPQVYEYYIDQGEYNQGYTKESGHDVSILIRCNFLS